jgi:hypothetical protein
VFQFRPVLEVVEETKDQIILREKPHRVSGTLFCVAGLLAGIGVGAVWRAHHDPVELVLFGCLALYFWAPGLYALLQSTLTVSRLRETLCVERRLTLLSRYSSLSGQAGVLNECLGTSRHGKGAPPAY